MYFGYKSTQYLYNITHEMTDTTASMPLFRIGAVSKTTGIPVSTLRIWETRYGAFSPLKTEGKQRLYEESDVSKAILLKQLSMQGHAISAIAKLDLAQLRRMSHFKDSQTQRSAAVAEPLTMAVVGLTMANRIESEKMAALLQGQVKVTDVLLDLDAAQSAVFTGQCPVILIKVNTLHAGLHRTIEALVKKHHFEQVIVVYHFATEALVQLMKSCGMVVKREPISDHELTELLLALRLGGLARAQELLPPARVIPPRKYSDETLSRVAGISSRVLCECPRHVAELLAQLVSLEQYSQECLNQNSDDAHLHADLRAVAGFARSLFERALENIALHEGIDLGELET